MSMYYPMKFQKQNDSSVFARVLVLWSCQGAVESSLPIKERKRVASLDSAVHYLNLVDKSILSPKGYANGHALCGPGFIDEDEG